MNLNVKFYMASAAVLTALFSAAAQNTGTPDLRGIQTQKGWKLANRSVQMIDSVGKKAAHFDARQGDGLAWLEGFSFSSGVIECDILGRSKPIQGSFVGIAFRVLNADTFDAVYFRPFNFRSEDSTRRAHSVQYVSNPAWTWPILRRDKPGQYEKPIEPPPDGDQWFHVRIVLEKSEVRVYVNDAKTPCLVVNELGGVQGGSVGLFVGNGSPGAFANFRVSPCPKTDHGDKRLQ